MLEKSKNSIFIIASLILIVLLINQNGVLSSETTIHTYKYQDSSFDIELKCQFINDSIINFEYKLLSKDSNICCILNGEAVNRWIGFDLEQVGSLDGYGDQFEAYQYEYYSDISDDVVIYLKIEYETKNRVKIDYVDSNLVRLNIEDKILRRIDN